MTAKLKLNDEEIFESLRSGKGDGFTTIFKEWYKPVYYFVFSILKNKHEAEDITDESFIKIWERRNCFVSLQHCKSFLYKCARNSSIDILNKHKSIASSEKEMNYLTANNKDNFLLEADIISKNIDYLEYALKELPPGRRKIFSMIYKEGKSAKQVAAALNISVNTVKSQKQKGFLLLRKILIPYFSK